MSKTLRTFISEMLQDQLSESATASQIHKHMMNVDYDEFTPNKHDQAHIKVKGPVASYHNDSDYSSHLYHVKNYSIIKHGDKDHTKNDPYDDHHKIDGHVDPKEFHKAMKKLDH